MSKYENVCVAVESEAGSIGVPIVPKVVRKGNCKSFGLSYLKLSAAECVCSGMC